MNDAVLNAFKPTLYQEEDIDRSKVLNIAIIGTGWIAESHIEAILQMPDVKVVAAADLIDGKAERFMKHYGVEGVRFYHDHKELLAHEKNLDAVDVCTYNRTHAECTIAALEAGYPVLCEKPMCVTLDEAVAMCRAEKKSGKLLSIGFQPRMDPNMKMIKKIVDSGVLGHIYYIQTGGGRRRGIPGSTFIEQKTAGIGALGDIGCYSLDMVLNAIGYPKPLTVTGYTSSFFGTNPAIMGEKDAKRFNVDDFGAAFIRLDGDTILDFRISWAMHLDTPGDTVILGTEGALRIPSTECWNGSVGGPLTLYHDVAGEQVQTSFPILPEAEEGLFFLKIRSFLDAVRTGGTAPVPTSQILYNQAIIDGVVESAKVGHEIKLDIPEI